MGAVITLLAAAKKAQIENESKDGRISQEKPKKDKCFSLTLLPNELALEILSHLNATDLCLAGCNIECWKDLTDDDMLWYNLVLTEWTYTRYIQSRIIQQSWQSFKKLYLIMDEAQLIFAVNPLRGIEYLQDRRILSNDPSDIALYLHKTQKLKREELCNYLVQHRQDVLEEYVKLEDYSNQAVLPNVLRKFFHKFPAVSCKLTKEKIAFLLLRFSLRYSECNPQHGLSAEIIYNICCSLLLLGYDLTHPLIKNKMSKREFIRNTRHITPDVSREYLGHVYDNVYLIGPVAAE